VKHDTIDIRDLLKEPMKYPERFTQLSRDTDSFFTKPFQVVLIGSGLAGAALLLYGFTGASGEAWSIALGVIAVLTVACGLFLMSRATAKEKALHKNLRAEYWPWVSSEFIPWLNENDVDINPADAFILALYGSAKTENFTRVRSLVTTFYILKEDPETGELSVEKDFFEDKNYLIS